VKTPKGPTEAQARFARQMRVIAIVIAGATVLWLVLGEIGREYGWPPRFALLIDFAALAAYAWALINAWVLWRKRQDV
jgi:hypothetical protein